MIVRDRILAADRAHVWHPYTAADAWELEDPIVVARAQGSWLEDIDGRRYLDGNASWWVASLGHAHPRLARALADQVARLDHVALAGITHEAAALLAEELCALAPPGLRRVFFTDNGSTAVEVAVKIAIQSWRQRGRPEKTRFVALEGAFHGDTVGAASLGGVEVFRRPFAGVLFECFHADLPGEAGYARAFAGIEALVRREAHRIAAVVVEPMLQGAAGMRTYPASFLQHLRALCTESAVLLVADEVFTGYGRTGPMWAVEHAGVAPDLMCVGKGFSQIVPMGATLATEELYDAFRGPRDRALMYGHTFCGNPMGAALAREVLAIYRDEAILAQVASKAPMISRAMGALGALPGVLRTRSLGLTGAVDLAGGEEGYLGDLGWRVYQEAKRRGAYLRPLGSTVYVCPPLTIGEADLELLLSIFGESIQAALEAR